MHALQTFTNSSLHNTYERRNVQHTKPVTVGLCVLENPLNRHNLRANARVGRRRCVGLCRRNHATKGVV